MKLNDYWRLAKISLKARKKATRSTVRGMSISLIIIVPVVFAIIALYSSVLPQLNKNPESLYAIFTSSQNGLVVPESKDGFSSIGNWSSAYEYLVDRKAAIENMDKDTLHYVFMDKYVSPNEDGKVYERIQIDGVNKPLRALPIDDSGMMSGTNFSLAVVDEKDLGLLAKSNYGVLGDTHNKGFSQNGARQVILSRKYLKMAGLTDEDVYGKKISIYLREMSNGASFIVNGTETNYLDHYLLRDFEVVGVIGSENDNYNYMSRNDINFANIIVSSASYYGADGYPAIANNYSCISANGYNRYVCDFGDVKTKNERAKDYVFTGCIDYGAYTLFSPVNDSTGTLVPVEKNCYKYIPNKSSINPYGDLAATMSEMYPAYKATYESKLTFELSGVASEFYTNFSLINLILTIAMAIVGVFAGIILFAALVNLFNTIMHSVTSRKNYLGVMRAIGARSNTIPKLYLFEVLRVFARAFIWIAIFGGAICIGIKILFDYLFKGGLAMGLSETGTLVISISWGMIPVALLAVMALLIVIGLIYSIGCSWKLSRKPIMEILEG